MSLLNQLVRDAGATASATNLAPDAASSLAGLMVAGAGLGFTFVLSDEEHSRPLVESGLAYLQEEERPNPLVVLANSYELPEGYDDYEVSPGERENDDDFLRSIPLHLPDDSTLD